MYTLHERREQVRQLHPGMPDWWIRQIAEQDTARMAREEATQYLRDACPLRPDVHDARDLDDAPTFTEALAAVEAHKARRRTG